MAGLALSARRILSNGLICFQVIRSAGSSIVPYGMSEMPAESKDSSAVQSADASLDIDWS